MMNELSSTYSDATGRLFDVGDAVIVKTGFPSGHCRTPLYIRGKRGVVERICGAFQNPETLAYGEDGNPTRILYRIQFAQHHVWSNYSGAEHDTIELEIYEHWLDGANKAGD
jgi:nitrile hydratase